MSVILSFNLAERSNTHLKMTNKALSPRKLIMSLINVPEVPQFSIQQLIKAGELFGFENSAIRMAAARLSKEQLINSPKRGSYQVGENALKLHSENRSWRHANSRTVHWSGDWLIALTQHLGRSDSIQLRINEKAFKLYGFAEIETGVWLRPANLAIKIEDLYKGLVDLGINPGYYLLQNSHFLGKQLNPHKHEHHWPIESLEQGYITMIQTLETSAKKLKGMSIDEAAKESLLVGESAIRLINLDPLLPEQMIKQRLFKQCVNMMLDYDIVGHQLWQSFFAQPHQTD